jgi:hypothetical protein
MRIRWNIASGNYQNSYLEVDEGSGWKHYQSSRCYRPDVLKGASKGYATMQCCLKHGYAFAPTKREVEVEVASDLMIDKDNLGDILGYTV